jgi:hypothetical protein
VTSRSLIPQVKGSRPRVEYCKGQTSGMEGRRTAFSILRIASSTQFSLASAAVPKCKYEASEDSQTTLFANFRYKLCFESFEKLKIK